jgi:hypothetical protein
MASEKTPARDVVNFSRVQFSIEGISNILFEQIGGIELISMVRRDTVEGQNPYYTVISNLSNIKKEFDPTQIISRQKPNQSFFDIYSIDINTKIPNDLYLERNNLTNFFYTDTNGDFVIELDNMLVDEVVELEIAQGGTISLVRESE